MFNVIKVYTNAKTVPYIFSQTRQKTKTHWVIAKNMSFNPQYLLSYSY